MQKKELIHSDEEVIVAVGHFLEVQDIDFNQKEIHMLHDCWFKCLNAGGDHDEKYLC